MGTQPSNNCCENVEEKQYKEFNQSKQVIHNDLRQDRQSTIKLANEMNKKKYSNQKQEQQNQKELSKQQTQFYHAPDMKFAKEVMGDVSMQACNVNLIKSKYQLKKLAQPQDYSPSPLHKETFYYIFSSNLYYKGEWFQGVPHGLGEVILKDGSYFRGYFIHGIAKCPQGVYISKNGAIYEGAIIRTKKNNIGKQENGRLTDGNYVYQGQWIQNLPQGNGKQHFPNNDKFQGRFVNGQKNGEGVYTWNKGPFQYYSGYFQQNNINKLGSLKLRQWVSVEGVFQCDQYLKITNAKFEYDQNKYAGTIEKGQILDGFSIESSTYSIQKICPIENNFTGIYTQLKTKDKYQLFKGFKIIYYDNQIQNGEIERLLIQIQKAYNFSTRHSQALAQLQSKLPQYKCKLLDEQLMNKSILIVPICGKKILIAKKLQDP